MANIYVIATLAGGAWLLSMPGFTQDADPTRPAVRAEQVSERAIEVSEYRLTSVWYRGANADANSSAVINGQRLETGDEVGSFVIALIEPGQVLLKNDDGEMWLRVFRSSQLTIEPSRG